MMIHPRPEYVERDKIPIPIYSERPTVCREVGRHDGLIIYVVEIYGKWQIRAIEHSNPLRAINPAVPGCGPWDTMDEAVRAYTDALV